MSKQPTLTLIESIFSQSKEYIGNRLEIYKLKAISKTSSVASAIVLGVALFVVFFIFFIVFNVGIALLIGDLLGKSYLGFLIWAAFYAIVGFVLFSKRNKIIKTPITKMIIGKFL
ncbi:MAG: hypothetical protein ACR2KZ_03850 [Segetibacter sp.]